MASVFGSAGGRSRPNFAASRQAGDRHDQPCVGVIAGIEPVSLIDFPGHIAATIFLAGCNLRCPFCHNVGLVLGPWAEVMTVEELTGWLAERSTFIDGICVTGGEPTLSLDRLVAVCRAARRAGLAIKLDTNGTRPDAVGHLIDCGLVDYVAVDIKASPRRYSFAAGRYVDVQPIESTVKLLRASDIGYELRTTIVPRLHDEGEIAAIGKWIGGPGLYALQPFRPGDTVDPRWSNLDPPAPELLSRLAKVAEKHFEKVMVRA